MHVDVARSSLAVRAATLKEIFKRELPMLPAQWAADNLIVPDGEYQGQKFEPSITPYVVEPMNKLGPDDPCNEMAVRKSAQTGFTLMLIGAIGHSIDRDPCDMMVVQPTDSALTDFNSQKLGRAIEKSATLRRKIKPQAARSGTASTTYEKKFGDNSLVLAIATSAADLSSKTIKKAFLDEVDRYPFDVDGQGSPIGLVRGRQTMFLASGTWKRAYISTPTVKGGSEIDALYEAGDQRQWNVVCPGCANAFVFKFGPQFRYELTYPHKAHYVAPCCGTVIEAYEKNALVQNAQAHGGGWIATRPAPGRYPSYHFDALSSPFVPWDEIAKQFIACADDPEKLKPFYNLVLGLPYEVKGDAPDYTVLMARREDFKRGHIPPGALLLTVACDVQMRGIYYEVVAWTPNRRSFVIDADYLDGATTDVDGGAFEALTQLYHREWPDAYGARWRHDEFGIDSGYRSGVVYEWTRRHPGTKALKGNDGWGHPALGVARDVDVDYRGKVYKRGAKLRAVGTWPLKGTFYAYVSLQLKSDGSAIVYPPGYCHFGGFLDEVYFRQITSEYLVDETYRGKPRKLWKQRGDDNHFLDCRVYNMALADSYLSSFTTDDWAEKAKARGIPEDLRRPDLFTPKGFMPAPELKPIEGAVQSAPAVQPDPFAALGDLNKGAW